MLTHILEVLKDDPAMRLIILQKLLENKDISGYSSLVELATELRSVIYRTLKILMISDRTKAKTKEKTLQRS